MSKFVKNLLQEQYRNKFEGLDTFIVVNTKGITGNDNNALRGALSEKGVKLAVVKNSMMCKALDEMGLEKAKTLFAEGPCTVAYGGESIVDAAKELVEKAKKIKALEFSGAFLDGEVLGAEAAKDLSKLPTKAELQGEVTMLAMSPGRRIAGAVAGPGGIIAGCVKGLIEKLEKEAA
jgi:large subunit ribosomal protein L10